MKVILILISFSFFTFSNHINGQTLSKENTLDNDIKSKTIELVNHSKTEEVSIHVDEKTPIMDLQVIGKLSAGFLVVELINPIGQSQKKFTLKANKTSEKFSSVGEIIESSKNPLSGTWILKIDTREATGLIKIECNFENNHYINVPNKFSPDNDGKNDTLEVEYINISKLIFFQIYNREGQQVFSSTKINEGWDGHWQNILQKNGTYYYVIKVTTNSGKEVSKNGFITLTNNL